MTGSEVVQLVAIIIGSSATVGTVVYKFGQLEGRIAEKLESHERRLVALEGERRFYVRRAEDAH